MPANHLPPNPSLEQLRKRAKELRDRVRTGHPNFTKLVREMHPRPPAPSPTGPGSRCPMPSWSSPG